METNRKILKYGVLLLVLISAICYLVLQELALKQPIFIKNYIQNLYIQEDNTVAFSLEYITNRNDSRKIWDITLDEYPEFECYVSNEPDRKHFNLLPLYESGEEIGMYRRYCVYVSIKDPNERGFHDVVLTQATLFFSDGSSMKIDLGRIEFVLEERKDKNNEGSIITNSSSASNTGEAKVNYSITSDMSIISITNPYAELIGDDLQIELIGDGWNHKVQSVLEDSLNGRVLHKGDKLSIHSLLDVSLNQELKYAKIDIMPVLTYENNRSEVFHESIFNIRNYPYIETWWDIYQYSKHYGEE